MDLKIAWDNLQKICNATQGNAEYHEILRDSIITVKSALTELALLKGEANDDAAAAGEATAGHG